MAQVLVANAMKQNQSKEGISNEAFEYVWKNMDSLSDNLQYFTPVTKTEECKPETALQLDPADMQFHYSGQEPDVSELFDNITDDVLPEEEDSDAASSVGTAELAIDLGSSHSSGMSRLSSTSSWDSGYVTDAHEPPREDSSHHVPTTSSYAGKHDFQLGFETQVKNTKAISWTYSPTLPKLFVRMAASCPIRFSTTGRPPRACIIRAMPVYTQPEHVQEAVRRCANHSAEMDHSSPSHLLRCDNEDAEYFDHPANKRLSVSIPYQTAQAGAKWSTYVYQFMCFSSCVGGLNRRPMKVIFTLESSSGTVLGRQSVDVRICACPGRDRTVEERAAQVSQHTLKQNAPSQGRLPVDFATQPLQIRGQDVFTLTVVGEVNYQLLCEARDALEMSAMVPSHQRQAIKQHRREVDAEFECTIQPATKKYCLKRGKP